MALLAGLLWLPGFAIERAAFRKTKDFPHRGLTRLCLGTAFWMAAIFFLSAAQILTLPAVGALVLASAAGQLPSPVLAFLDSRVASGPLRSLRRPVASCQSFWHLR